MAKKIEKGNSKVKEFKVLNSRVQSFEAYGLNKFRNFISPIPCDCGCGGYAQPVFKTRDELINFIYIMLADNECNCCAVFAHGLDNEMYAGIKYSEDPDYDYYSEDAAHDEDNPIEIVGISKTDYDYFRYIDAEYNLHCYGLLVENLSGSWTIVQE